MEIDRVQFRLETEIHGSRYRAHVHFGREVAVAVHIIENSWGDFGTLRIRLRFLFLHLNLADNRFVRVSEGVARHHGFFSNIMRLQCRKRAGR